MDIVINYWAVLVAAIVSFFIGMAWYSPLLFVKPWMHEMGKTFDPKAMPGMSSMASQMAVSFVAQLVGAYVLAHVAVAFGAVGVSGAVQLAVWVWIGFLATNALAPVLWEGRSMKWYAITAGHLLISTLAASLILVLWV